MDSNINCYSSRGDVEFNPTRVTPCSTNNNTYREVYNHRDVAKSGMYANDLNICTDEVVCSVDDEDVRKGFEVFLEQELESILEIYLKKGFKSKSVLIALGIYLNSETFSFPL